jgi:hypothetical protein
MNLFLAQLTESQKPAGSDNSEALGDSKRQQIVAPQFRASNLCN